MAAGISGTSQSQRKWEQGFQGHLNPKETGAGISGISQEQGFQGHPNPKETGAGFQGYPNPREMGAGISGISQSQRKLEQGFHGYPRSRGFRDTPVPEETGAGTPRGDPGSGISSGSHPRSIFHVTAPELQGGNAKGQLRAIESRFSQGISERRRWHQSNLKLAPNPRGKRERKNPKNPAGVEGSWRGSQSGEAQGYWWLL